MDGIVADPFNPDGRFVLYEIDNGLRYKKAQACLNKIKTKLLKTHKDEWDPEMNFYGNLSANENLNASTETVHDVWNTEWRKFLRDDYAQVMQEKDETGRPLAFWFTNTPHLWKLIFYKPNEREIAEKYMQFQDELLEYWHSKGHLNGNAGNMSRFLAHRAELSDRDQLPLPQTCTRSRPDPTVAQLQSRISALESRLSRVKQEENMQHLLEQVLERLDTPHVD